jgi:hypothetical protein
MKITPKNWRDFQHYKDRNPPWIRLHKTLLDNSDFHALTPMSSKVLVYVWLLASENVSGSVDANPARLAFRLRLPEKSVATSLNELYAAGFLLKDDQEDEAPAEKSIAQHNREKNGFGSRHISDKTKRFVWERDEGKCVSCTSTENIEFDHIHPVSKGGNSEPGNVQLLCRTCNRKKRVSVAATVEQVATPAQPWLNIRTSETETEAFTEAETETGFDAPRAGAASPPAAVVPLKPKAPKPQTPTADVWAAYSEAYRQRYQADPVRNATVNGQMAQLVARLGAAEAPEVARFFLAHRGAFYVKSMHSVGSLLSDCEKLRTEWVTGQQMTQTQAIAADKTQTNLNAFGPLIRAAQEREANERESQHG